MPGTNQLYDYPLSCSPYILAVNANGAFAFGASLLAAAETYSVSVATQPIGPTQYCIVQNADGTMPSANVNSLTVSCSAPRFAYGAGGHANAVFGYTVDPNSGALTVVPALFPPGHSPTRLRSSRAAISSI